MREHLLGYLLGALEQHESEAVRQSLESDEVLRRELEALRRCLEPLGAADEQIDPPAGLAMRTCNYVAAQVQSTVMPAAPARTSRWSFADVAVAATVLVAASALFFPAMQQSRYNAQVAGCQNNMREASRGMAQMVDANGGFLLVNNLASKNEAVAGITGVALHEQGLVDDSVFICPGSTLAGSGSFEVPTRSQLRLASGLALANLQRNLSGSYGFLLGYVNDNQLQPVRYQSRANYAVMADAPSLELASYQTSNHGARGQNVLFEDGHVRFMRDCRDCPNGDDVFHNDHGELAPGIHRNDSVIAPSHWPLAWPMQ